MELVHVSTKRTVFQVMSPVISSNCHDTSSSSSLGFSGIVDLSKSPFVFSRAYNRFTAIGCDNFATISGQYGTTVGSWWMYKVVKGRQNIKLKEKYFKRNGGLLMQQQLSSSESNIEKAKFFTSKELEKDIDNYNENRILAVPLQIYEFIPNRTLFQLLHHQTEEEFLLTWEMRLQIAVEVASALSYLHSSASIPIHHRDIKSSNILLNDKYRGKVSDFGTSRSVAVDQTHLTTRVLGTFGYFDPQYFQSSQFIDKSDVYSFRVVLVELLTGKKPISSSQSDDERSLATHFLFLMHENHLFEIIDARIEKETKKER
ncbi:hypothetical protein HS088_TW01G00418 [Tripterygium wilfordii]|uniref:Protein kinase domain-containing protein n=1 Tax=Tripterygium wilfordii TaxID=458696 RepID=A0A7J7E2H4_TRIWF|nr:hypothetical protein HS088_TW01G00418 [Tripterygium wilfordii]